MKFDIKVIQDLDLNSLQANWTYLESKANITFFLSWSWIKTWLLTYNPKYKLVTVEKDSNLIAMGIFCNTHTNRHNIINSNRMYLHQTGDTQQDQIWIEYNELISIPEYREEATKQCLEFLYKNDTSWDEIIFSMIEKQNLNVYKHSGLNQLIISKKQTYRIDLKQLRTKNIDYIETLSKNSRYQIRRSIRQYKDLYGDIVITKAQSISEAVEYFHTAAEPHTLKWHDSGFKNQQFISFHENLIKYNFDHNDIEVIKIQAGEKIIGITYNFTYKNTVYFYLHALFYDKNKTIKPGLVLHSLLIQKYLEEGFDCYDFMGGYSQFKKTLASRSVDLVTVCLQKKKFMFQMENVARNLKQWKSKLAAHVAN